MYQRYQGGSHILHYVQKVNDHSTYVHINILKLCKNIINAITMIMCLIIIHVNDIKESTFEYYFIIIFCNCKYQFAKPIHVQSNSTGLKENFQDIVG